MRRNGKQKGYTAKSQKYTGYTGNRRVVERVKRVIERSIIMKIDGYEMNESSLKEIAQPLAAKKTEFVRNLLESLEKILESIVVDEGLAAVDIFCDLVDEFREKAAPELKVLEEIGDSALSLHYAGENSLEAYWARALLYKSGDKETLQ